jgi:hypothetical protein
LIIALPDARHFDGDPQPRWEIRLKIGNRLHMLNLFQHAVTIAFFCFFLQRSPCFENNMFLLVFLSISSPYQKNMIPLAPPSHEGMGEASLAPQGATL